MHFKKAPTIKLSREVLGLLENGMNFLQKAQDEFSISPTHSIVSFWTAVELLLKVPLAHEHWSLICSGKRIVRAKYLSGEFQSITFTEVCERLRDVLEKPLPTSTFEAFETIRRHRNRVVHFYHNAFTLEAKNKLLSEQADAWFALNRLMMEDWKLIFEGAIGDYLSGLETNLLIKNTYYSEVKFSQVREIVDEHVKDGGSVTDCYLCKKNASIIKKEFEDNGFVVKSSSCIVCASIQDKFVEFLCPECKGESKLLAWDDSDFECSKCQHSSSRYDLFNTSFYPPDEYIHAVYPINCSECENENSVCELDEGYFCTHCFVFFDDVMQCASCGQFSTNVDEENSAIGCNFCDGLPSSWSDDD
ncbi:hypothetical protein C7420_101692 [Pantoea ananatis]|uniref:hsdR n=1 Tax=Pantoea ananas TaxID=553 RepID=UPI000DC553CC|nr:hsdR [Pantoea ananatis]RAR75076.1 hypothetical protein C7420_101692 [Pantoea ananatis]